MLSPDGTKLLAVVVLAGLAFGVAGWLVVVYRRTQYTLAQAPIYLLNQVMSRVLWRTTILGKLAIGPQEGAVIVCNHRGPIDPAFIGLLTQRSVHWMVAEEYCRSGLMAASLRILQVIPARRAGVDTAATKLAIRYAQQGDLVGMFPEGRINNSGDLMLPGRPGAVVVALKAKVRVVPCYLSGTPNDGTPFGFFFIPARVRLVVGEPVDLSPWYSRAGEKEVQAELTRDLLRRIAVLAGRPDFQPQLAGRRWKTGVGTPTI